MGPCQGEYGKTMQMDLSGSQTSKKFTAVHTAETEDRDEKENILISKSESNIGIDWEGN